MGEEQKCTGGCENIGQLKTIHIAHEDHSGYEYVDFYRCGDCNTIYSQTHWFDPFDGSDCLEEKPLLSKRTIDDLLQLESMVKKEGGIESIMLPLGVKLEDDGLIKKIKEYEVRKEVEIVLLKHMPKDDNTLCFVHHESYDGEDCTTHYAEALVIKKDFIEAMINSMKYGKSYTLPDAASSALHNSHRSLRVSYAGKDSIVGPSFNLGADVSINHSMSWPSPVWYIIDEYLRDRGRENQKI